MTDDQKKSIEEIVGHLGAALSQTLSTDDAIIIGHIRAAHAEASRLMSGGKIPAAPELEECACGRTYSPVDENGEDADMCKTCRENEAEAAYERSQEEPCFRGGEWAAAQAAEADWIRRNLK
ncbi:MAG: hypothetical protein M0Z85_03690 [Gammaproteobacteria bacterium]|jgi:hypothetical protein|nr:hypothetical protein [Gammaproteobacteria bacterium]